MRSPAAIRTPASRHPPVRPALGILVAYGDFFTGAHAVRTVDRLFRHGKMRRDLRVQSLWQFDLLGTAKLREIAAADAARADLVILCAQASRELDESVKQWIPLWLGKRAEGQVALVTVLDKLGPVTHQRSPLEIYFEQCAARAGMGFFVQKPVSGQPRRFVVLNDMPPGLLGPAATGGKAWAARQVLRALV